MLRLTSCLLRRTVGKRLPKAVSPTGQIPVPNRPSVLSSTRFDQLGLDPSLTVQYTTATQVQSQSYVPIFSGKDVSVCSETGSGKTLAYLVPLMNRLLLNKKTASQSIGQIDLLGRSSPPVVVLCPSNDLCRQVLEVAIQIDPSNQLTKQWLDGPSLPSDQTLLTSPRIRWGATDLVVCTPLKFFEDLERFRQDNLKPATIVFDEADFLFQGSTQGAVLDILSYIRPRPGKRMDQTVAPLVQCVFASATMPDIGKWTISPMLIQRFMTAEVVKTAGFHSIPSSISSIQWVPELEANWDNRCFLLTQQLSNLFEAYNSSLRVLVFVNTQHNASVLYSFLKDKKWPVALFKKGKDGQSLDENPLVIVATDAGARGMDWNGGVDAVINFQMPTDVVTWVHRAGRCGRLGKSGSVVSFFKEQERNLVELLKNRISNRNTVDSLFSYKRSLRRRLRDNSPS